MQITFNRQTALFVTRKLRAKRKARQAWGPRVDLIVPDPKPRMRWTRKYILQSLPELLGTEERESLIPIEAAVPQKCDRLQMRGTHSTIYASRRALPPQSFIAVEPGVAISCPELLFIEMGNVMDPAHHLMLGHELCGGFSRDAVDPRNGAVTLSCPPATSRERIERYLQEVSWCSGAQQAKRTLALLSDNAWSPTESVVATIACLPFAEWGYELGPCELNVRVSTPEELTHTTDKESRVPDILFPGTRVGLNYDGAVHLNLDSIVQATALLERNPGQLAYQQALDEVVQGVRAKAVDDIRRNRELAADGFVVFPVTKEDLYEEGGFDRVMAQVIHAISSFSNKDMSKHLRMIDVAFAKPRRQKLIWSLLPGRAERQIAHRVDNGEQSRTIEVVIGF